MPIGATVGLAAAGFGLQAYGQYKGGQAQKKQYEAASRAAESEAQLADFNAHVAELQAEDALERGDEAANRYRVQARGIIGTQRAGQAAGNIDVSYGSAADVQADAAFVGKLDEVTIRDNARREAWGFTVTSLDYKQRAKIAREKGAADLEAGDAAATAGTIGAVGTLATGAGSTLSLARKYGFGDHR